ncbi:hypothetical protein [uncultured Meiothermus sp.]|jgi:hypothetical protein|uniref:hypothetical protein n=1 Tax=uncultured Meiothermus sp. TaxID=157471 RepID=UPI002601A471|nr:hypothetical protein [uncultured Meiothermus sp.]
MITWLVLLVIGLVVVGVVGWLLNAILKEARTIEKGAGAIWDGGKRIANNTVHVPDLIRTNHFVGRILAGVPGLHGDLERIRKHAETCPGCPQCVVGGRL